MASHAPIKFTSRVCVKCGVEKMADEFYVTNKVTGRRERSCKPCVRQAHTDYERRCIAADEAGWRGKRRAKDRRHNQKLREELKALVKAQKARPCADCKIQYPPYVMQFDHLDGTIKEGVVGKFIWEKDRAGLIAEMQKCDVVCANCHAERTHQRRGS